MKEARIILPLEGNSTDGNRPPAGAAVHRLVRTRLAKRFGGYTRTTGFGGWVDSEGQIVEENVAIYDVAINQTAEDNADLRAIAVAAACNLLQDAVYFRPTSGLVEIIKLKP